MLCRDATLPTRQRGLGKGLGAGSPHPRVESWGAIAERPIHPAAGLFLGHGPVPGGLQQRSN